VRFSRVLKGLGSVFHRLPGVFVSCQVIFFAMMHGRRTVGMSSHFVKLGGPLVEILRHNISFQKIKIRRSAKQNDKVPVIRAILSLIVSGIRCRLFSGAC
jgi:hypothetical protein